jgi:hypothetical protein
MEDIAKRWEELTCIIFREEFCRILPDVTEK